jgi:hypothetical protein
MLDVFSFSRRNRAGERRTQYRHQHNQRAYSVSQQYATCPCHNRTLSNLLVSPKWNVPGAKLPLMFQPKKHFTPIRTLCFMQKLFACETPNYADTPHIGSIASETSMKLATFPTARAAIWVIQLNLLKKNGTKCVKF